MFGQPTIVGGRVFFGSQNGHVYSPSMPRPDATTGTSLRAPACALPITIARIGKRDVALFGDRRGHVYSVDAATGELVWRSPPVDGPRHRVHRCADSVRRSALRADFRRRRQRGRSTRNTNAAKAAAQSPRSMRQPARLIWKPTPSLTRAAGRTAYGTQLWGPSGVRSGRPRRSIATPDPLRRHRR